MKLTTRNYDNKFNLFDDLFYPFSYSKKYSNFMSTDISIRKGNYEIDIDIPGYSKEDLKVTLEDGYLTVSALDDKSSTKCEDNECEWIQRERFNGNYSRTFYLGVDDESNINAVYHSGVLTLVVPIKETKKDKTKYIDIK